MNNTVCKNISVWIANCKVANGEWFVYGVFTSKERAEKERAEKRKNELSALAKEYVYLSMMMDQFYFKIKDDSTRFFEFVISNFMFYYYGKKASNVLKKLSVAVKTMSKEEAKEVKDIVFGRLEEMKKVLK